MAREIFISYSRNNLDLVKTIKSEIERETGTECWMDLNVIESGTDYLTSIEQGILNCKVFLFMLSLDREDNSVVVSLSLRLLLSLNNVYFSRVIGAVSEKKANFAAKIYQY